MDNFTTDEFERALGEICRELTIKISEKEPLNAKAFEFLVREVCQEAFPTVEVDFYPGDQVFPDIAIGQFGIEVKLNSKNSWRSIANSVMETNRNTDVKHVYVVYAKLGGTPKVDWSRYEDAVMHVRTSHVPRFEIEIGTDRSLFKQMGVRYDDFRELSMHEKMDYIRGYARSRLSSGERLWWLEDLNSDDEHIHTLPIQARLYTSLSSAEKKKLRAEATLLCPQVVSGGRARNKYDDVVLYLMTYHGVLCHQARDLYSAGSVGNPDGSYDGRNYVMNSIRILEPEMKLAASYMDGKLFEEYWGADTSPSERIFRWLELADGYATNWKPSEHLFLLETSGKHF